MNDQIVRLLRQILIVQIVIATLGALAIVFWIYPETYNIVHYYRRALAWLIAIGTIGPLIIGLLFAAARPDTK